MTAKKIEENSWLEGISTAALVEAFTDAFRHQQIRPKQLEALKTIADNSCRSLLEMPTGEGKTDVGMAALIGLSRLGLAPLYYITPTKGQVKQIAEAFPDDVVVIYGRKEYPCLYYADRGREGISAEDSPCYMLQCPHRVNQETGETEDEGAEPCPYYQAKFEAKEKAYAGKVILCTTAFFLVNRLLVPRWQEMSPGCVVVDEVHNIANTARRIFEYTLTDYHLYRCADLVQPLDPEQAEVIKKFAGTFVNICYHRQTYQPTLLKDTDLLKLMDILEEIRPKQLDKQIRQAVKNGQIDPIKQKGDLKTLENLVLRIPKMLKSLHYAMASSGKKPLNYVVAFYYKKDDPEFADSERQARFFLTIYSYYVIPIIRKALGERGIVAYSATIGDPRIFGFESGLELPFRSFTSSFDTSQTRIFMPNDTPDLAEKKRRRNDLNSSLRLIIRSAVRFKEKGLRSLIVVVSEMERQKVLEFAVEEDLQVISYGNGTKPGEAVEMFKSGEADALLGTSAQFAEGIDLPGEIAPVIFFLRPGYCRPDDPEAQFEERRFSDGHVWALRKWRVMLQALQVRGRNIRDQKDRGVCFFISQGFKGFLYNSLPEWLKSAYRKDLTMEDAVQETLELLI